jgi:acyl-CoA reductase-like NAD-dependent aldehyde dehydrogenase
MATQIPELCSYVGGSWRQGATALADINPANPAETVATTCLAGAGLAAEAIEAAAQASSEWRRTAAPSRGDVLRRAADLIDARADEIAQDVTREEGKTKAESLREVRMAARTFRYYAGQTLDPDGETFPSHQSRMLLYRRSEPVGVVSVITPWNFPIWLPSWKLAPALAFGNSVVWKPAELVPLSSVHLTQALVDAGLPDGVLNLVIGKGSVVGDVLVGHPAVDAVTFTGSTQVGRALHSRTAPGGKKVQLELGGKNPAVVLADADLDLAAQQISIGAFGSSGQKCTATSRVIVERSVVGPLVERIRDAAEQWRLGDPLDAETTLGPLASANQMAEVLGHLEVARSEGARAVAGGGRADGALAEGYFVHPTVLVDVAPTDTVAREEIFGPVVAILPAESYDEAVAIANDTPYGLSASLFTQDLSRALHFAEESRTGVVRINQGTSGMEYHVPFGGVKDSGFGHRELGKAAREFFTESKTVYLSF